MADFHIKTEGFSQEEEKALNAAFAEKISLRPRSVFTATHGLTKKENILEPKAGSSEEYIFKPSDSFPTLYDSDEDNNNNIPPTFFNSSSGYGNDQEEEKFYEFPTFQHGGQQSYEDIWKVLPPKPQPDKENIAVVSPHGTMVVRLRHRMKVDITVDQAVRITNPQAGVIISLSASGSKTAILHPNGRVWQYGSRVEVMTAAGEQPLNKAIPNSNTHYAKMWYKGVSFTAEKCALVYLVDSAGTRTTTDYFADLTQDFSVITFFGESQFGVDVIQQAVEIVKLGRYWVTDDGYEHWIINGIRITQTPDGLMRLSRNNMKHQIRTSPTNGTVSVTTPFIHCTASMGQTSHLFVKRGERRMHYDGTTFIVRNAGHSAGFDENNAFKVY